MASFSPIQTLYNTFNELFGQGSDEIFQMEIPARLLDKGTYDYKGSDTINAQQLKPQTIVDAEFRLSDDMYTISNMMGGPNGKRISRIYNEILFDLVPTVPPSDKADLMHTDQDRICAWLLEQVPDITLQPEDILKDIPVEYDEHKPPTDEATFKVGGGNGNTIARVDLYQKLLNVYQTERFRWATFKTKARPKDMGAVNASQIDNFNRMLAIYAPIVDSKLEALWTLLLVRGEYHRIRRFVGFVDVGSASETLQRAKESLRASIMRSIDDTEDVYPVYFSPATWASKLSTAFKPEDLLSSESVLRNQLFDKEKERASLLLRRSMFKAAESDMKVLQDAEVAALNKFNTARDTLIAGYSDTAIKLIQMYFDATSSYAKKAGTVLPVLKRPDDLNAALALANESPLDEKQFAQLQENQGKCIKAQSDLQSTSEALSRAQLAAAAGRGSDDASALYNIEERIQSLTVDIDYLMQVLSSSSNPTGADIHLPGSDGGSSEIKIPTDPGSAVPTSPQVPPQEEDASIWQELIPEMSHAGKFTTTLHDESASHIDWSVDLFFGSASGSNSKAEASSKVTHNQTNTDVQVGFRCMKVIMNRPWLDGSLLGQTNEFCRKLQSSISASDPTLVKKALKPGEASQEIQNARKSLFPAWPIAFIVVKDVHVILTASEDWDESEVHDLQKKMSAGGGVLCFSCAKSQSSSEHRTAAALTHDKKSLSIRIPAPQIIGWIQKLVPKDESQASYNPLEDKEFFAAELPTPKKVAQELGPVAPLTPPGNN